MLMFIQIIYFVSHSNSADIAASLSSKGHCYCDSDHARCPQHEDIHLSTCIGPSQWTQSHRRLSKVVSINSSNWQSDTIEMRTNWSLKPHFVSPWEFVDAGYIVPKLI